MDSIKKYIIIILGIYLFWLAILPEFMSRALATVAQNLSYNSSYDIKIVNPRIITNIIPKITFKAEELEITKKSTKENIHVFKPKITVRLLPLLSGTLHVNKISASRIYANSQLLEKPRLDKDFFKNLKKERVVCDAVKIKELNALVKTADKKDRFVYKADDVYYRKNGRFIKINVQSEFNAKDRSSKFDIKLYLPKNNDVRKSIVDVDIDNLDIAPIANFLKNYLPPDMVEAKGLIDIDVDKSHMIGAFKDCAIVMKDSAKSMIFPNRLEISSNFDITRKLINIDSAQIVSNNINTIVSGTISDYLDKALPAVNLQVRLNKSRIEDFISMLPAFKTEDIDMYKLKKYKFFGDIIGNFSIKGDNLEPSINGNIFVNNGILTKPIPNSKGATIKLKFLGKYLNYDIFVPAGVTEKVWVKGGVELYNVKYADMRVWSTSAVDLALAEEKVNPIHEILNFVIGPVPIMDIKGNGNIDITIKGNRKNPHVWGTLNFNDVTTNFNDIPDLVLQNGKAVLTFDDENAVFELKEGDIDGKKVDIKGSCNLDGKFDFDTTSKGQNIGYLYNAVVSSQNIIEALKAVVPKLDEHDGLIDFKLKVYGHIKDIEQIKFGDNFFTSGEIKLLGNSFGLNGIKISDTKGNINFDGSNVNGEVSSTIEKSPLTAKFSVKDNNANLDISVPKLNLGSLLVSQKALHRELNGILVDVNLQYNGKIDEPSIDKLNLTANVLGAEKSNRLQMSDGEVLIKKGKVFINNLRGKFLDTNSFFDININIDNISNQPVFNGNLKLKDFELSIINLLSECSILPEKVVSAVKSVHFEKGKINLNAEFRNNSVNASTNIGGIQFTYMPADIPVKVINGSVWLKKNHLGLNKINILADEMPILLDGGINDIFSKQEFNLYINSKPKQEFIDKYINNNRIYPLKIKGDIVFQAKIKGVKDNFDLSVIVDLAKEASMYYLGAMVGDVENPLRLKLDTNIFKQNIYKLKEFSYDKIIPSLGTRQTKMNMLKAEGGFDVIKDDLIFHDLHIKTQNPTDAKVFNIIFRKPNIKQGQFTSDLKLNGKLSNPRILGSFHIFETNLPFWDMSMKNVTFLFKDRTIDISSVGEIMGNEVKFKGILKNKLTLPYVVEDAEIYTKEIDLNYLADKLKMSQMDNYQSFESSFNMKNLVIKNLKMVSNVIRLRNLVAKDVEASTSLTENKVLNFNNFRFKVANGNLEGKFSYNMLNDRTTLDLKAQNIDANAISYAIFDLKNQIYGDLTGSVKLACTGSDFNKCMQTLSGNTSFNVANGKMPKLGSLEYLLRAGNLLKGGVTNLSINSVIDIITPLKTGEFSDIYGNMTIHDGVTDNLEISTKGKALSLFLAGQYNFATADAEMEVLGLLSKKISTMFGPIGNVSLNTLFNVIPGVDLTKDSKVLDNINKIPGVELSSKAYRKFLAEIKGNINGDNYVKSFSWIN